MQLLDLLLLDRPYRNGIDPPAAVGIGQRLGVGSISLVAEPILSDELSGEQDRFVAKSRGLSPPEVRSATGFEQHDGTIGIGEEAFELFAGQPQVGVRLAPRPGNGDLEDILCEIDGDEIRLIHGLLLSWDIQRFTPECWHIAMPQKTREESISSLKYIPTLRASSGRGKSRPD
jgi:hypothetical protein